MKKVVLIAILLVSLGIAGYTFYTSWRLQDPQYQRERTLGQNRMNSTPDAARELVDLDDYAALRPSKEGTREIVPLRPISFDAAVKQVPKEIKTDYLYEAMGIMKIDPLPVVTHRMFVETAKGHVMPVYVWDGVAKDFAAAAEPVRMVGFHIYTYSKGAAIIVDGVLQTG